MEASQPLVAGDNLLLQFGTTTILDEVNLQLVRGQRVALVGRNGEGKSCLLKILAGRLEPDAGTLRRDLNRCLSRPRCSCECGRYGSRCYSQRCLRDCLAPRRISESKRA